MTNTYQPIARRYRPQRFDQVVGQPTTVRLLTAALTTERVAHAYLFAGIRGTGKTSLARILAKAINCTAAQTEPCNTCELCQNVAAGCDPDVIEIDGASTGGVDEVRKLTVNAASRPQNAEFKIYIIDEVHMLTKAAFNALLKTVEEPPAHIKFIFCTTEPGRLPPTFLSRCQRYDTQPLASDAIAWSITQIAGYEGYAIAPDAASLIARRATGSLRDAQTLLDTLLAAVDGSDITCHDVSVASGSASPERIMELLRFLAVANVPYALRSIEYAIAEGADAGELLQQLQLALRDVLVIACEGKRDQLNWLDQVQFADVEALARYWPSQTLLAFISILDKALDRLPYTAYTRELLDIAILRISHTNPEFEANTL